MLDIKRATFSGLQRFAECVDTVMEAEGITDRQRVGLISHWAYRADEPGTPAALAEAIKRCQADPDDLLVTSSSIVHAVTGEVVAFNNDPLAGRRY